MEFVIAGVFLLILGMFAGFAAGLLGIGGGVILVPGIYYILKYFGFADVAMHVAVGTSLATIIFTGASSALAHHRKGAVDIGILKQFLPGVVIGVLIGTWLSDLLPTMGMKIVFVIAQLGFGCYMIFRSHKTNLFDSLPRQPLFSVFAALNAGLAAMMGVGGGTQNIIFMTICNVNIHKAIATAASIGPFIAMIGASGFIAIGLDADNLPPHSLGYVNLAAFGSIVISSVAFAPLGVRAAHALPVPKLKKAFAIFILLVTLKMLLEILTDYNVIYNHSI